MQTTRTHSVTVPIREKQRPAVQGAHNRLGHHGEDQQQPHETEDCAPSHVKRFAPGVTGRMQEESGVSESAGF
jgi:hypothetical protein